MGRGGYRDISQLCFSMNRHESGLTKGHVNPGCHSVCHQVCHSVCHPELVSGSQTLQNKEIPKQVRDDRDDGLG